MSAGPNCRQIYEKPRTEMPFWIRAIVTGCGRNCDGFKPKSVVN